MVGREKGGGGCVGSIVLKVIQIRHRTESWVSGLGGASSVLPSRGGLGVTGVHTEAAIFL